jgi:hypothetical protein
LVPPVRRQTRTQVGAAGEARAQMLACAAGPEGAELMARSAKAVAERDAWRGCVIHLEGQRRCVREDGAW